ncbi:MAG: transporter substrate-binding domain-containing protein [Desulfobacteraceae bacterium]|nr:transporter substrate-binding domain-containing protein [Desulfobacteraceae bacterium]
MIPWKRGIIIGISFVIGLTFAFSELGHGAPPLFIIITDPYEPLVFPPNTNLKGLDYEVTEAIFRQLQIPMKIKFYPWKRCLQIIQNQEADGILDLAITEQRKAYLFFPKEPLSDSSLMIFYHKERPVTVNTLDDLKKYQIGTQYGYEYPQGLAEMLVNRKDVKTMEQNLRKLKAGRIDLIIENRVVGLYRTAILGMQNQIDVCKLPTSFPSKNYLGFAKKKGYDHIAKLFSQKLVQFKQTQAYHDILVTYGQAE